MRGSSVTRMAPASPWQQDGARGLASPPCPRRAAMRAQLVHDGLGQERPGPLRRAQRPVGWAGARPASGVLGVAARRARPTVGSVAGARGGFLPVGGAPQGCDGPRRRPRAQPWPPLSAGPAWALARGVARWRGGVSGPLPGALGRRAGRQTGSQGGGPRPRDHEGTAGALVHVIAACRGARGGRGHPEGARAVRGQETVGDSTARRGGVGHGASRAPGGAAPRLVGSRSADHAGWRAVGGRGRMRWARSAPLPRAGAAHPRGSAGQEVTAHRPCSTAPQPPGAVARVRRCDRVRSHAVRPRPRAADHRPSREPCPACVAQGARRASPAHAQRGRVAPWQRHAWRETRGRGARPTADAVPGPHPAGCGDEAPAADQRATARGGAERSHAACAARGGARGGGGRRLGARGCHRWRRVRMRARPCFCAGPRLRCRARHCACGAASRVVGCAARSPQPSRPGRGRGAACRAGAPRGSGGTGVWGRVVGGCGPGRHGAARPDACGRTETCCSRRSQPPGEACGPPMRRRCASPACACCRPLRGRDGHHEVQRAGVDPSHRLTCAAPQACHTTEASGGDLGVTRGDAMSSVQENMAVGRCRLASCVGCLQQD
jgi:hypothetical protein